MYPREENQEITPISNLMAIALACILATPIIVVAMTVISFVNTANKAQAEAIATFGN